MSALRKQILFGHWRGSIVTRAGELYAGYKEVANVR